jgi:exodeoxyribonuclease-5
MLLKSQDSEKGDNRGVQVRHEFFNGTEGDLPWQEKKGTQEFTYGYAITCHKSQGSQWDHVTVFNEGACFREDAKRWAYTAITRAARKLTVVI